MPRNLADMNLDGATRFRRTSRRLRFRPGPLRWTQEQEPTREIYSTKPGAVYQGDCLELLKSIRDEAVHTLFADPPFNLKKQYAAKSADDLPEKWHLTWSK